MVYNVNNFPYEWLETIPTIKRKKGNQGTKRVKDYLDLITAFDIETTNLVDISQAFMYVWQYQLGLEHTVIGRTWEEFTSFMQKLKDHLEDRWLVTFVHNLSFEYQYLAGIYPFKPEEVFCTDPREVLKCYMYDCVEFRCSYRLSNLSLDNYTHKWGVEHAKTTYNYKKYRDSNTVLTPKELEYITNDVLGLVEAISKEMAFTGDNLQSIPMTSTGYVRRNCKKAMRDIRRQEHYAFPDKEVFILLREAFRGGDTHNNRFYSGEVIENVKSKDRSSSYPERMVNGLYPIRKFKKCDEYTDIFRIMDLIYKKHMAILMRIHFKNIRLTDVNDPMPYIPRDKCWIMQGGVYDNGRVLRASYIAMTITDIDFKIIQDQYSYDDVYIEVAYYSYYGKLPKPLREEVLKYYRDKTALKGTGNEAEYNSAKALLNSIY